MVVYRIVVYCMVVYRMIVYCMVVYRMVVYCMIVYGSVLYCMVVYCMVVYCIVLYSIGMIQRLVKNTSDSYLGFTNTTLDEMVAVGSQVTLNI